MKLLFFMALGIILHISIVEFSKVQEIQRLTSCTSENIETCEHDNSWLFKHYPDRLYLEDCVISWDGPKYPKLCKLFRIRSVIK